VMKRTFRMALLAVWLWCVAVSTDARAQELDAMLAPPVKVLWVARESIDGKDTGRALAPVALKKALEPKGFIYLEDNKEIAARCDFEAFKNGQFCDAIKPWEADLVLVSEMEGSARAAGVKGQQSGVKMKLTIQMWRVDLKKKFNEVKQPSYGIGDTPVKAVFAALKKVDNPVATRLTILSNLEAKASRKGVVTISGLKSWARICRG